MKCMNNLWYANEVRCYFLSINSNPSAVLPLLCPQPCEPNANPAHLSCIHYCGCSRNWGQKWNWKHRILNASSSHQLTLWLLSISKIFGQILVLQASLDCQLQRTTPTQSKSSSCAEAATKETWNTESLRCGSFPTTCLEHWGDCTT